MNSIFRDVIDDFLVVYMDDLLIFSRTRQDHQRHVALVLGKLQEHQLYVSPKKCQFFQEEVEFLGLIAGRTGKKVDPAKVEVIHKWTKHRTITDLRGFLGLAQFLRRFIKGFSAVALALTDLTKKENGVDKWDTRCDEAFVTLKKMLMTAPILAALIGRDFLCYTLTLPILR